MRDNSEDCHFLALARARRKDRAPSPSWQSLRLTAARVVRTKTFAKGLRGRTSQSRRGMVRTRGESERRREKVRSPGRYGGTRGTVVGSLLGGHVIHLLPLRMPGPVSCRRRKLSHNGVQSSRTYSYRSRNPNGLKPSPVRKVIG